MPKRILIFSLVYYPRFVAGAEVAVKEITDRIAPSEIEFDMITLNGGDEPATEKIGNVTVHRLFRKVGMFQKLMFPFTAFSAATILHRRRKYDATWSIMANFAGFAALFFKLTHPSVSFILTLQEGDPFDHIKKRVGILYPVFKMIFRKADQISALSKYLADWAKAMGAKCPVTVIPNGVDYNMFSRENTAEESQTIKSALGKKENDVFLITTSRLVAKNAAGDIIRALQYLASNVKFLVVGQGEEDAMLKDLAKRLKLTSRVIFLGFVPHAEMIKYLHISDIFVRPSLSEGLGNSFPEAMAAGLPVIATPVGGILDFLVDGETGLFCEVKNPRSIAQKVEKLIKDRESREYIVSNARKMVEEKYQWREISERMKSIFEITNHQRITNHQ